MKNLLPHQRTALSRIVDSNTAFLAMEMRLGKTLTALRWLQTRRAPYPCLVVAPLAVLPGWEREAQEEGLRTRYLAGLSKPKQVEAFDPDAELHLVNYESLILPGHRTAKGKAIPTAAQLLSLPWRSAILDESTRIRNPKAQITKVLRRTLGCVEYRMALSGLPNPEGLLDLFEQLCWTHGRWAGVGGYWEGRARYFHKAPYGWDWLCNTEARQKLKQELHAHAVVMSRKDVGLGIKSTHQTLFCELPKRVRAVYAKAESSWELGQQITAWAPVASGWLNQLTGGYPKQEPSLDSPHKLNLLLDVLRGRVAEEWQGQPTLVWFRYLREIQAAEAALRKLKLKFRLLTGASSTLDRRRLETDFRAGKFQVLLGQERCGRFGLDLSRSSLVVHFSHSYEFETYAQLLHRTEHPLKHEPTHHLHLTARSTIDEDLAAARSTKALLSSAFRSQFENNLKRRLQHA